MEEPGEDTSKYDVIMPAVVHLNVSDNAGLIMPEYENDKVRDDSHMLWNILFKM